MKSYKGLVLIVGLAGAYYGAHKAGLLDFGAATLKETAGGAAVGGDAADGSPPPPAITVDTVSRYEFVETALVTGSVVAREEIQVAPEVEGLKVLSLNVDEGDTVKKGDVLAVLVSEQLDAQIAQSAASVSRAGAAIAQAKSQITEAEARVSEANASLERARPLQQSRYLSESAFDQREAAAKTARAQLAAAKEGLKLAEAELVQVEAQKRELNWKRGNTQVRAPDDGLISRRNARIGGIATGATEPMFRIIRRGEIELDAEISETRLAKVRAEQKAHVTAAGGIAADGTVRLVSPEVDKATRLGHVRVFIGADGKFKIGSFGTAQIETARKSGLAIPQSSVLFGEAGPTVLAVVGGRAKLTKIETGLMADGRIEVLSGLAEGDLVVTKAGTFLRDGDAVKPISPGQTVSEVR